MADEGLRLGGFSSGLACVLNNEDRNEGSGKSHLVSYCENFGDQSVERTIEHIFDLPCRSIDKLERPVDDNAIRSIIENEYFKYHPELKSFPNENRDGISTICDDSEVQAVRIEESSICGDISFTKKPLFVQSHAVFSSARSNTCLWKGKWMYEVTLETCGVQQLGWVTVATPFTDHRGVGDAEDSYAYDGKRMTKWNGSAMPYGQSWAVGDVIGCCIDLDSDEILYYRNGISLGLAFGGIRKKVPGLGYYPAFSLSRGERCELNFGGLPFKYPVKGFLPIQAPPTSLPLASNLLDCFLKLLSMQRLERAANDTVEKLSRLKRFASHEELFHPVSLGICEELLSSLESDTEDAEYVGQGPFLMFLMEVFGIHPPHDYVTLDKVLDSLLEFEESRELFMHVLGALSSGCKTAPLVLTECPYSGSYSHLALACHILRREELMTLWWISTDFDLQFEGFLSRKIPDKVDLQCLIPSVWWPGSVEDISNENSMVLTTTALSEAVNKIEEKQRDLCRLVMQFIPPTAPPQLPGSVFREFLRNILLKNRGADRNSPPPGVSNNSVLVSLFTVILHFLSEGFAVGDNCGWIKGSGTSDGVGVGFLHRGGQQCFPASLFLKNDPHRVDISRLGGSYNHLLKSNPVNNYQEEELIRWYEGCMDDEETRVAHASRQKPCCCSSYDSDSSRNSKQPVRYLRKGSRGSCSSMAERSGHVSADCAATNIDDEIADKPSTSDHSDSDVSFQPMQQLRISLREDKLPSATLKEEELLDSLLLLYHLGLAPNFKQASSFMSRQSQSVSLLEETDRQIRECLYADEVKRLKESRSAHREELMDCVRHCAWYRLSLLSRWKQRGMYAACMWIVQMLLVLSKVDSIFGYVPEYYVESVVDCFHVLRKCDPPFVPVTIFIKQGFMSFITFVVIHFNDQRISSAELRDLLLQSISVLVQYNEFLAAFECNKAATERMPKALLSAFDNRSWIPVTNILLRLCKGSGFGSKYGESSSSSSSAIFQKLLREACISNDELFSSFLNRLFNTLSWAMTEFSISVREMQEMYYKVMDFQQRKCGVIFDLSCNLARVLEFCTREVPQVFLSGIDTNLRRLTECIIFILNQLNGAIDPEVFELSLSRYGNSSEKVNRGMILAPLAGIILNLLDASKETDSGDWHVIVATFASMGCSDTILYGFQHLLEYNWAGSTKCDDYSYQLSKLEKFSSMLINQAELQGIENMIYEGESETIDDGLCCICYTNETNAHFLPCSHVSCYSCISRHLINCERCFFCNAKVVEVVKQDEARVTLSLSF